MGVGRQESARDRRVTIRVNQRGVHITRQRAIGAYLEHPFYAIHPHVMNVHRRDDGGARNRRVAASVECGVSSGGWCPLRGIACQSRDAPARGGASGSRLQRPRDRDVEGEVRTRCCSRGENAACYAVVRMNARATPCAVRLHVRPRAARLAFRARVRHGRERWQRELQERREEPAEPSQAGTAMHDSSLRETGSRHNLRLLCHQFLGCTSVRVTITRLPSTHGT